MPPIVRSSGDSAEREPAGSRRRFLLFWVAPILLLLVAVALPLILGNETLYLRDVLNTHYEMKWSQAQAMAEGRLPLIDLYRGGGQAHLANPNTVPLYPDNVLFWLGEPLWALNAHFWLHWLLAPLAGYWLGRALGMRREAAWAVGAVYATSGFYLSTMNLYNLVAPVTLAPALLACALNIARPERRWRAVALGALLWALMILGGDPMTAATTLAASVFVVFVRHRWDYPWLAATGAVVLGTGVSAPQWVEFLRMLSFTFRGFWGFGEDLAKLGGWRPMDAFDLILPMFFGRPDLNYWGQAWHADQVPLLMTYYPGFLVLALMIAARRDGRRTLLWAWLLVGGSLFLALGEVNPVVTFLAKLSGASLLRLPAKLWSLVSLGSAVLCGLAFSQLFDGVGQRRLARTLLAIGAGLAVLWVLLSFMPETVEGWLAGMQPDTMGSGLAAAERLRMAGSTLIALLLTGFYLLCLKVGARRSQLATLSILIAHVAGQLLLLGPMIETDERAQYLETPELAARIPSGSRVVHGGNLDLFGKVQIPAADFPDVRLFWRERQMHADMQPAFGVRSGLRYELNLSPEGLDSFLTRMVVHLLPSLTDDLRVKFLQLSGVEYLLLERAVDDPAAKRLELLHHRPTAGGELHLYRVLDTAPEVQVVGRARGSLHLNQAVERMIHPDFDHLSEVILAGEHETMTGLPGTARVLAESSDSIEVAVSAPQPAVLLVQRTHLPIYRATIDGNATTLYAANIHRTAVKIPAGDHVVRIAVDRQPLNWALAVAAICLLLIAAIAWRGWRAARR